MSLPSLQHTFHIFALVGALFLPFQRALQWCFFNLARGQQGEAVGPLPSLQSASACLHDSFLFIIQLICIFVVFPTFAYLYFLDIFFIGLHTPPFWHTSYTFPCLCLLHYIIHYIFTYLSFQIFTYLHVSITLITYLITYLHISYYFTMHFLYIDISLPPLWCFLNLFAYLHASNMYLICLNMYVFMNPTLRKCAVSLWVALLSSYNRKIWESHASPHKRKAISVWRVSAVLLHQI